MKRSSWFVLTGEQALKRFRKPKQKSKPKPMKTKIKFSLLVGLIAAAFSVIPIQAQTNTFTDQVAAFFQNNPTNLWELGAYGMADVTGQTIPKSLAGIGGGLRLAYWINSSVGVALDGNYIDGGIGYGVFSMTGRGTARLGTFADLTFYAIGGPGYLLRGGNKQLIAMVGTGVDVKLQAFKFAKFFAEIQHRTTSPTTDLAVFGMKKEF